MNLLPRIIIIGGGAGGIELATRLGHRLRNKAQITLVDQHSTHLWKPLLHEVAAGTLPSYQEEISFMSHAYMHHFDFQLGQLCALDRKKKTITLAAHYSDRGQKVLEKRTLPYDHLVIAIGSESQTFGIPGTAEHCFLLENREQAERFNQTFVHYLFRAQMQKPSIPFRITVIGGGATGVELAAELHKAAHQMVREGFHQVHPKSQVSINIVESADRLLSHLAPRLSEHVTKELTALGIHIYTGERVSQITHHAIHTEKNTIISSDLNVWAAGIKAPAILGTLDDLETDARGYLKVLPTLQTTRDPFIFALGDCAAHTSIAKNAPTPPRAQAAHQQAIWLANALAARIKNKPIKSFEFHDHGSLITLGQRNAVGQLMGNLSRGRLFLEGKIARWAYLMLYKQHQFLLHGITRTVLMTLTNLLSRKTKPRVKMH